MKACTNATAITTSNVYATAFFGGMSQLYFSWLFEGFTNSSFDI
jgi:hypothetical protein